MEPSISTSIFVPKGMESLPIEQCIENTRQAGFRLIEFSKRHQNIAPRASQLNDLGLSVWSVHGSFGTGALSASKRERQDTIEAETRRMEDAAAYAPCPYVIHYLNRFNDPSPGDYWKLSVETLLKQAERLSLTLAVESVPFKPEVNERYADSAEVAAFVRSLASEYAKITLDLNHSNLHEDLTDVAGNFHGLIANIHVSDNHGQREEHLVPGDGVIDFTGALQTIVNAGYAGPLNLECHTPGYPTPAELQDLRLWAENTIAQLAL